MNTSRTKTKERIDSWRKSIKLSLGRFIDFIRRPISITALCAILSLFTLVAYNIPVIKATYANVESDFNGWLILATLVILLLVVNFILYYILLYAGRIVGKVVIAFTLIGNAVAMYFVNTYNVILSQEMMGNVFNTRSTEAFSYFSLSFILYVALLGIIPCIYLFMTKIDYKRVWHFIASLAITIATILCLAVANRSNILWIDRNATQVGGLLMPYSYTVNSALYYRQWKILNREEIKLPDATISTPSRDLCVVVIGESARSQNFSLYGYERDTNPLLATDSVKVYNAHSANTYTTAGVKAILDHKPTNELYEILPNYLHRTGVEVLWRTSNWGEPKLNVDKYQNATDIKTMFPDKSIDHDDILLAGLREEIEACDADKMLVVLHTSTSHGPTYYKKYPAEFEHFTPVCTTVEMSKANRTELVNAYDNSILYTDYVLHSLVELLRTLDDRRSCMIYVSDHGESLGEDDMYMHGVPMSMAPKEQYEIPFIVWSSDSETQYKELSLVGQYHIFHSVLHFLGIESPIFNEQLNIFAK